MHKRTRRTLFVVAAVLLMLAVAIFLRSKAPPEAARLLPESDGIIYFNLKPVRVFLRKGLRPPKRVPEYQQFVDATGVDWERDLDAAAIALHRMPDPNGPNGPVAYSMVLVGKLTGQKLNSWLESHANSREAYAGHSIYNIPSEDRIVRVAQIGYDMIAVSNFPTTEQIHSIIDRHRTAALPFSGSTLLAEHYREVPLLSLAWGIGQVGLPFSESGSIKIFGFSLPIEADSTIVASVTPGLPLANSAHLRVEEIASSDEAAAKQAASLAALVTLARTISGPLADNTPNRALKELLRTAEISQRRNRVVATAAVSPAYLGELTSGGDSPAPMATSPTDRSSK